MTPSLFYHAVHDLVPPLFSHNQHWPQVLASFPDRLLFHQLGFECPLAQEAKWGDLHLGVNLQRHPSFLETLPPAWSARLRKWLPFPFKELVFEFDIGSRGNTVANAFFMLPKQHCPTVSSELFLFGFGMMWGRKSMKGGYRLCIKNKTGNSDALFAYLAQLPLPPLPPHVAAFLRQNTCSAFDLELDWARQFSPSFGISCYPIPEKESEFLHAFLQEKWLTAQEKIALLQWIGKQTIHREGKTYLFYRIIHHIKICITPQSPPFCKAYFSASLLA